MWCAGKVGLSSLSGISKRAMAYCLTKPRLSAIPTSLLFSTQPDYYNVPTISAEIAKVTSMHSQI